ncbi:MAG: DUF721 domain-containing protein [Firmicutes bacterium]|nr:DUF721 domain-containing protein [Candidatus Fermentithermobacillaceae bacterium]
MRKHSAFGTGMAPVSEVLEKTLGNMGLLVNSKRYQVFSVWPKVVGDIARHAKPRRLDGDVLFVATASSVWSQELTFMQESILEKLRVALKGDYVREIRFSEHLWDPSEDGRRGKTVFPAAAALECGPVMDAIPDERLASSARRFSSTMARRKLYLLRRGYTHCRKCGCLYPSSKRKCPYCAVQEVWRAKRRAIAILEKNPHLTDQEVMSLIGCQDAEPVRWARQEMESRYLAVARSAKRGSPWRRGSRLTQKT